MMLKHLSVSLAVLLVSLSAIAVPAKPGAFPYTQPDGTVISLELHGDEYFHWTTLAGTRIPVALGADGFWRKTTLDFQTNLKISQQRRKKDDMAKSTHNGDIMTHGERHIPVLVVSFSDNEFTIDSPAAKFDALLNQVGYSANGGTGSVRDYFWDNSHGAFTPVFDVYGPVKLPQKMAYYGGNDKNGNDSHPAQAVTDAAKLLDGEIDFTKYDCDNDGYVDMVLLYYAGYNEAENGGEDTIWPHSSGIYSPAYTFDGKVLGSYFCTSELKGSSGSKMCGIGTTSHEFGHSLGLPDFYDTNYDETGKTHALSYFSIMCSGSYNNDGRTPPSYNVEERIILGWMSDEDILPLSAGDVNITSVREDVTYRTYTDTDGEYFLYECRDGQGWDAPLPKGLVVYHVDKSKSRSISGNSPYHLWEYTNSINAFGSHPCFYVVPSSDQKNLNFKGALQDIVFPGSTFIRSYTPLDWDNKQTGYTLTNISFSGDKVSMHVDVDLHLKFFGTVKDIYGKPLSGVYVLMTDSQRNSYDCLTGNDGSFEILIDGCESSTAHVTMSKSGFQTFETDVTIGPRGAEVNAVLTRPGESEKREYSYYIPDNARYVCGISDNNSSMAAIRIPANDLPQNGGRLTEVRFEPVWQAEAYYVLVDSGSERLLCYKVPGLGSRQYYSDQIVDLSALKVDFPGGKDLYVGVAVEKASPMNSDYNGMLFYITLKGDNLYLSEFDLNNTNWHAEKDYALALTATVFPASVDLPPEQEVKSLAEMGFASIYDPGKGRYTAGESLPLMIVPPQGMTVEPERWTFDGADVTGAKSVALKSGKHTITAKVKISNGDTETLQLVLTAD